MFTPSAGSWGKYLCQRSKHQAGKETIYNDIYASHYDEKKEKI